MKRILLIDKVPDQERVYFKLINAIPLSEIEQLLHVEKTPWVPDENEENVLYFFGGSNVPRFKTKEKFSNTIKPGNATVAFVCNLEKLEGNQKTFTKHRKVHPVKAQDIHMFMTGHPLKDLYFSMVGNSKSYDQIVLGYNLWCKSSSVDFYGKPSLQKSGLSFYTFISEDKDSLPENQLFEVSKNSEFWNFKGKIFHEREAIRFINRGKDQITEEQYQYLRSMGKSSSELDWDVLTSIMMHCDFENSLLYLLLLMEEFGLIFQKRQLFHQVGFRSLMSFLGLKKKDLNQLQIGKASACLQYYNQLSPENILRLSSYYLNRPFDPNRRENKDWTIGPVFINS